MSTTFNMTFRRAGAVALLATLTGCVEYRIETTVSEDGGGVRSEEMLVDESGDTTISLTPEQFVALLNLGPDRGWSHSSELRDGDTVQVFKREKRVADAAGWSALSGDVRIDGALPRPAEPGGSATGPNTDVPLPDVRFRNIVEVTTHQEAGSRVYTYRETFTFDGVIDAIIENRLATFRSAIDDRYRDLDPGVRGELIGLGRAGLRTVVDLGILDTEHPERDDDRIEATVGRITAEAERLLRRHRPTENMDPLVWAMRGLLVEGGEADEEFIERNYPGAHVAANTGIRFRLHMPGNVVSSNAHERDDDALVWEFGPWDAAVLPVEIHAESRLAAASG